MPKERRDSALVDIVQKLLKDKFPEWYRKDIHPIITQSDFTSSFLEWLRKESPRAAHAPDYLKPKDLRYSVTLYYEKWQEEKLNNPFTAVLYIIAKTQEAYKVMLGSSYGGYESLLKPNKGK